MIGGVCPSQRRVYHGPESLVVAIDVGATRSAVCYVHLVPEDEINEEMVSKWSGQKDYAGECKIPTMLAYRPDGKLLACGAEARSRMRTLKPGDGVSIVREFKLHLHRYNETRISSDSELQPLPPIPPNITLHRIYVDFLRYLFTATRKYFVERTPDGQKIWDRLKNTIFIVFAVPNGWDVSQHTFLRAAAESAGLLAGQRTLQFVTESEASVHFVMKWTKGHRWLKDGSKFVVCDAGGSTVDSTLYECKTVLPHLSLSELCASECVQAGGIFVDEKARHLLETKLVGSKFSNSEFIDRMIDAFEKTMKREFDGTTNTDTLIFGNPDDNDPVYHIESGAIELTQAEISEYFRETQRQIVQSCQRLLTYLPVNVEHLLLVGGFGESPLLRNRLEEILGQLGTKVYIAEQPSRKAAAEGAAIWFTGRLVGARAARATIGSQVSLDYDEQDPEHRLRSSFTFWGADGKRNISGGFSTLVQKNTILHPNQEIARAFLQLYAEKPQDLGDFTTELHVCETDQRITWATNSKGVLRPYLRRLCIITADLSELMPSLKSKIGLHGRPYWQVNFQIVVLFGGTELEAFIRWKEGEMICEGPVEILSGFLV